MSKNKPSRLLAEIYETALDFHSCGLLSDERMNIKNCVYNPLQRFITQKS